MTEREFNIVRTTNDVLRVASAWRESGGAVFKVQLKSQARSPQPVNHTCTGQPGQPIATEDVFTTAGEVGLQAAVMVTWLSPLHR